MNVVNFPEIQALFPTPIGIYDLKEKLPYDELFRYCLMLEAEDKAKDHVCKSEVGIILQLF